METIVKIRRRHLVKGESISAIARDLGLSRNTVKKYLKAETEPVYQRTQQPAPKLGTHQTMLPTTRHQGLRVACVFHANLDSDSRPFLDAVWSEGVIKLDRCQSAAQVVTLEPGHGKQVQR